MNAKRLVLAWLAGFVTMMVLGGLFHQVLAKDILMEPLARFDPKMPGPGHIAVMVLVVTLIMAYWFPKGYQGGHPAVEGFRFGALVGVILALPLNVVFMGLFDLPPTAAFFDVPWHLIEQGVTGAVIGMVYGRKTADSP